MREITSHRVNPANDKLSIIVVDEPGAGGANHHYLVLLPHHREEWDQDKAKFGDATAPVANVASIRFQNGPIAETGVNGVTQEVLLAIVCDRLKSFQEGPYACRENAVALTHLETAQLWLHKRTMDRMARGVEGTHTK